MMGCSEDACVAGVAKHFHFIIVAAGRDYDVGYLRGKQERSYFGY